MRQALYLLGLVVALALVSLPATAQPLTLWDQEGTTRDLLDPVDVAGETDTASRNCWENWVFQYGSGSWTGIYGDGGWVTVDGSETGDSVVEVEANVELYMTQEISNNKIYFHIGNIYAAMSNPGTDLTAIVTGTLSYNNGMYYGICFTGMNKDEDSMQKDGGSNYTGVILGGMQSDRDAWRPQDNSMDIRFRLRYDNGGGWSAWTLPVSYGDGAHSTIHDTLWWLVNNGDPGTYDIEWEVRLLPVAHQPDGDYYLDPAIVAAPVL